METSRDSNWLNKYGAVWLTMLGMAVGGISWVFGLAGKVESNQEQIAALQAEVANRREAMSLIENVQRDVARLERENEAAQQDMARARANTAPYKELLARQSEHIEAVDKHLERVDDRLVQVERMLGWRSERGPGTGPDER